MHFFKIKYSTYIEKENGIISGIFYIHGLRNHNRCPGGDGGTPAGVRGNGNSGTGQPYLLINFEPWLRASPAQFGNKMFPPGKWDDQYDIGYQWRGGTNREEIPFTHGRLGNGYFCQICVKGGCENMTHLPITPPPPPPGKGLYIKVQTLPSFLFTFLKKLWTFIPFKVAANQSHYRPLDTSPWLDKQLWGFNLILAPMRPLAGTMGPLSMARLVVGLLWDKVTAPG